jgi:GNAT superfamily N-acetyltransferase
VEFIKYGAETKGYDEPVLTMFADYFTEINAGIPKKYLPKILSIIADETKGYDIWLYLCLKDDELIGFVMAQIDVKENPACKREGWGFIREFYIIPAQRRKGFAEKMCGMVEERLYASGAKGIYLTANTNTGEPFWAAMGYVFTGIIDESNNNKYMEKGKV